MAARGLFVAACRLLSSCGLWAPGRAGSVVLTHGSLVVVHGLQSARA